jgi:hypothetical protein
MIKILETQLDVPHPLALQLNYAALDFNYSSWMTPANLRVLQSEQSSGNLQGLAEQKDHFKHISPLSMVEDRKQLTRQRSWADTLRTLTSPISERPLLRRNRATTSALSSRQNHLPKAIHRESHSMPDDHADESGSLADKEDGPGFIDMPEKDRPIRARVRFHPIVDEVQSLEAVTEDEATQDEIALQATTAIQQQSQEPVVLGTRLTMTSRTGYFQDRIISPSMVSTIFGLLA